MVNYENWAGAGAGGGPGPVGGPAHRRGDQHAQQDAWGGASTLEACGYRLSLPCTSAQNIDKQMSTNVKMGSRVNREKNAS